MSPVDIITFKGGLTARIYHDDAMSEHPFMHDEGVRIAVLHRRYLDPAEGACGRTPDELATWEAQNAAQWFSIPLWLYDHSGTCYRAGDTNPFHCPWDSGRVGTIALKRAAWGNGGEPDETLAARADAVAREYTSWANGEVYGYLLLDPGGREIDSCWGYIGIDTVRQAAAEAAAAYGDGD